MRLGRADSAAARVWFKKAEAAGHPQACAISVRTLDMRPFYTAAGMSRFFDRAIACGDGEEAVQEQVSVLAREQASGNAEAAVFIDSLQSLGVFDRNPELLADLRGAQ